MERTNGLHQQVLVRLYFPCNAAGSTVRFADNETVYSDSDRDFHYPKKYGTRSEIS